jgi:Nif-specific regulatory protein
LTQTLHFMDKPDAVSAAVSSAAVGLPMPTRIPAAGRPLQPSEANGDGVTLIGPTHPKAAGSSQEPPDDADERERLIWAMEQCGWVQAKAARMLRLTPRQLGYALQKNRIEVRKF